jgi:hypothetical protein
MKATPSIPFTRLLRRYRAKAFLRKEVKLQPGTETPRITPERLREAGAVEQDRIRVNEEREKKPARVFDDQTRISILECEVRKLRQDLTQLRMRR